LRICMNGRCCCCCCCCCFQSRACQCTGWHQQPCQAVPLHLQLHIYGCCSCLARAGAATQRHIPTMPQTDYCTTNFSTGQTLLQLLNAVTERPKLHCPNRHPAAAALRTLPSRTRAGFGPV
jgi:hypothetical protein